MKSTGLFGKNSGRVGGVVYSNYKGEQVVRTYQPRVQNPNTAGQVAQRAKFKLVSQVSASLAKEINLSFVPNVAKESNRNAFVKEMLKKTTYSKNQASLPIEDIVITNSRTAGIVEIEATSLTVTGIVSNNFGESARVKVVFIGYSDGGEITLLGSQESATEELSGRKVFTVEPQLPQGYTNIRALAFAYEPNKNSATTYENYEVLDEEATLQDVLRIYSGKVIFSETMNVLVPQNV